MGCGVEMGRAQAEGGLQDYCRVWFLAKHPTSVIKKVLSKDMVRFVF